MKQDDIDFEYFEEPYFVTPKDEDQAKTFDVVREVLAETRKAGLGELAFGGREHLIGLMSAGGKESKGMMAYTLRYAEELRDGAGFFSKIKASTMDPDQLQLAKELIQRNSVKFDPKNTRMTMRRRCADSSMRRCITSSAAATRGCTAQGEGHQSD